MRLVANYKKLLMTDEKIRYHKITPGYFVEDKKYR